MNKLNGNRMNVGRDCMGHFDDAIKFAGKSIHQLIKDASRMRRLSELEHVYPGISRLVDKWFAEFNQLPLLIPDALEQPFRELGREARDLVDGYVSPDRAIAPDQDDLDTAIIEALGPLLERRSMMLRSMEEYVQDNQGKRFAVPARIVRWLERQRDGGQHTIRWLKEDGAITARTIFLEPNQS